MKNISHQLAVVFAVLSIALFSCGGQGTKETEQETSGSESRPADAFVLASRLALSSVLSTPNPDAKTCMQAQALYAVTSADESQLDVASAKAGCCCPCPSAMFKEAVAAPTRVGARDTTQQCPCPNMLRNQIVAPDGSEISFDDKPLSPQPAPSQFEKAVIFQLPEELTGASHVLKITGDFTGTGKETYILNVVAVDGKPALK